MIYINARKHVEIKKTISYRVEKLIRGTDIQIDLWILVLFLISFEELASSFNSEEIISKTFYRFT